MGSVNCIMKKWYGGVIVASLVMLLVLRYGVMKNSIAESYLTSPLSFNTTNPLKWVQGGIFQVVQNPENATQVISTDTIISSLFDKRNISDEEQRSLQTWNHLKRLIDHSQGLPNAVEAIKEARSVWNSLMASVEEEKIDHSNDSSRRSSKEKQCPYFLNKMNATVLNGKDYELRVPCGLTQGSSITIIGVPNGFLGNFRIDLTGEPLPGEPDPPIILHYNVRLHGDKITENPVIVQNTWTVSRDWGEEERCPSPAPDQNKKVDELEQCNEIVGRDYNRTFTGSRHSNSSKQSSRVKERSETRRYFPFKQGHLFVATLRVGSEGLHMTVDGKHITSFAFHETLEPWLVSEVRISGDLKLISVVASGLPTSEDLEHVIDLEALKSVHLPLQKPLDLFIGVFSTANNFKRRMSVRRTWMQYPAVRSGAVAVRFFVGLHKNQMVNEELWNEARTYGDTQLMPFVDYYSLITWKTLAICIFGTEVVSAKFVMKTDDDAFVCYLVFLSSTSEPPVLGFFSLNLSPISISHLFMAGIRLAPEDSDLSQSRTPVAGDLVSDDDRSIAADSWSIKSDYGSTLDDDQRHADASDALAAAGNHRAASDYSSDKEEPDTEMMTSVLGLQSYWDSAYADELTNFREHGHIGEVWFGADVMDIVASWTKQLCIEVSQSHLPNHVDNVKSESAEQGAEDLSSWNVLDIGTGNGLLLQELSKQGFSDLTGTDYSEGAINLAQSLANRDGFMNIKFQVDDVLETKLDRQFRLVMDKGTLDAIGLHPDGPIKRMMYWDSVSRLVTPGGILVITSCNNTKDELVQEVENFNQRRVNLSEESHKDQELPLLKYLSHVRSYPTFMFGGSVGSRVATVAFLRN